MQTTQGPKRPPSEKESLDLPDEAGKESFPASDPPSWTLGQEKAPKKKVPKTD